MEEWEWVQLEETEKEKEKGDEKVVSRVNEHQEEVQENEEEVTGKEPKEQEKRHVKEVNVAEVHKGYLLMEKEKEEKKSEKNE